MTVVEREFTVPWQGFMAEPRGGARASALVLAGSSGRIETERCRLLAAQGIRALSIRWFGGPGQPAGICEIPLETFTAALDLLSGSDLPDRSDGSDRLGGRISVVGTSKGAEAALLLATLDPRVDAVAAFSPTSVVWENVGAGADRSSWTWKGEPLPFVPYAPDAWPGGDPPVAFREFYERSLVAHGHEAAVIPSERSRADVLLVAGGDDQMWPSLAFARSLAARHPACSVIASDVAGHRPRLPGESPAAFSPTYQYGGTPDADAALGAAAWPYLLELITSGSPR